MRVKKLKIKVRFFAILALVITGFALYFTFTHVKKQERLPDNKGYSVQLKDVGILPITGKGQQAEKITKTIDSKSQFNFQYKLSKDVDVQFAAKAKEAPMYKIGDDKKYIQFSLKQANVTGFLNVKSRLLDKNQNPELSSTYNIFNKITSSFIPQAHAEAPIMASQSGTPTISENTVEYPVEIQGIPMTMRLTTGEGKIKEEFVISQKPEVTPDTIQIPFQINMAGFTVHDTSGGYLLIDEKKDFWIVQKPTIRDSQAKEGKITGSISGNTYLMSFDSSFLKTASFPVVVDPTVIVSPAANPGSTWTQKRIVATSDGTIHVFVQLGTQTATCGGVSKSGLLWFTTSDSGATWVCQGQIDSDTTNLRRADARVDSNDNIYLVYTQGNGGWGTAYDMYYRKLTKGAGSTWTIESSQLVLDGTATTGYDNPVLELEGTTRIWFAVRLGQNPGGYSLLVYYSSDMSAAPTWNSSATFSDSSTTIGLPNLVRYGSKIAMVYSAFPAGGSYSYYYSYRTDGDSLSTWSTPQSVASAALYGGGYVKVVGTTGGLLHLFYNYQSAYYTYSLSGSTWSSNYSASPDAGYGSVDYAISASGLDAWIFNLGYIGGFGVLPWQTKIAYRQGTYPFGANSYTPSSGTNLVSYHKVFDKVWRYFSSAYTDVTTAAGNTTTADVSMVTGIGDIMYFGQSEKYDAISWTLSTAGTTGVNAWEYCTAVDGSSACTTWSTLTFLDSSNANFTNTSGNASFTAPGDWVAAKVNGEGAAYYYIRARTTTGFGTSPVGTMFASIPAIGGLTAISSPYSNTIYLIWNEGNSAASYRIRSASLAVTGTSGSISSSTATDLSTVISGSSVGVMLRKSFVRTTDGTLHAFLQLGSQTASCSGQSKSGLLWFNSTDGGTTWTCRGQLNADITTVQYMHASAKVDGSDNIYVVYGKYGGSFGTVYDIYYRKLTYNGSSSWTMGSEQTALDSTLSNNGYANPDIEIEGTTRMWLVTTFYNGSAYQMASYYSDGFSDAPTWTFSANLVSSSAVSQIERFGSSKLGVVYSNGTNASWVYRSDSDGLSTWSAPAVITGSGRDSILSLGNTNGLFVASNYQTTYYLTFYNGTSWSTAYTNSDANTFGGGNALATDGTNIYYFEDNRNNVDYNMTFSPIFGYRKGVNPFGSSNFSPLKRMFSNQGTFQKVLRYASSVFYDLTVAGGNGTTGDTPMLKDSGDMVYFGKSVKFNAVYFYLSTTATGTALWEYWNGSDWIILNSLTDLTSYNLNTSNAKIVFTPPDDWAPTRVNNDDGLYYYVRVRAITNYSATPAANQFLSYPSAGIVLIQTLNGNKADAFLNENVGSKYNFVYKNVTIKPAAALNRGVTIRRGTTLKGN